MILGFRRVVDDSLLAPYRQRYFEALTRVWAERSNEIAHRIVAGYFPHSYGGPGVLDAADAWLADAEDAPFGLRRIIVEGRARRLTDEPTVRRLAEEFGGQGWPLEVRGSDVYGPHGPTAGPPPYAIYRLEPTTVFGLPGMHGMFDDERHHEPTRWTFGPG